MNKEEAITALGDRNNLLWGMSKEEQKYYSEALDMAISALKGLDLPDNATNRDAFNYMLRQTFPRVIFIHFHNEANLTEGVVSSKEWLDSPYKGVSK